MLKAYLKRRKAVIAAALVFFAVFAASFWLCDLPLAAVAYPFGVCAVIGLLLLICDYVKIKRRHAKLCDINRAAAFQTVSPPEPMSVEAEDLCAIIETLNRRIIDLDESYSKRTRDTVDYYTAWVHQIKTPIASMRLLLDGEDTALSRRLTSELFKIEQYVEMVTAYLRLDSESSDYVFKEYSVDRIIRGAVKKFAAEFIARKIRLEYEPADLKAITDEKWLSFVIEQLLSNALKYTREGSVKIYVRDSSIVIEDTGIGIAPEDIPRIFEKGYTGENGRLDKRASGLGLYLAKSVCDRLGIKIRASSFVGSGTAMSLDLSQETFRLE